MEPVQSNPDRRIDPLCCPSSARIVPAGAITRRRPGNLQCASVSAFVHDHDQDDDQDHDRACRKSDGVRSPCGTGMASENRENALRKKVFDVTPRGAGSLAQRRPESVPRPRIRNARSPVPSIPDGSQLNTVVEMSRIARMMKARRRLRPIARRFLQTSAYSNLPRRSHHIPRDVDSPDRTTGVHDATRIQTCTERMRRRWRNAPSRSEMPWVMRPSSRKGSGRNS